MLKLSAENRGNAIVAADSQEFVNIDTNCEIIIQKSAYQTLVIKNNSPLENQS